jgi:multimeric flavodoxin WrbA
LSHLLAISSSPRRGGNSEILLHSFCRAFQEEGWTIRMIRLNELRYRPCQACDHCAGTGACVQRDDMAEVYTMVRSARAMVLATPIYFGTVSGQLKTFIDRFQCWWQAKYQLKQPFVRREENRAGFLICAGALRKPEYCASASAVAAVFFHNLNFHYKGSHCLQGYDAKDSIKNEPPAVDAAYRAGLALAHALSGQPNGEKSESGDPPL